MMRCSHVYSSSLFVHFIHLWVFSNLWMLLLRVQQPSVCTLYCFIVSFLFIATSLPPSQFLRWARFQNTFQNIISLWYNLLILIFLAFLGRLSKTGLLFSLHKITFRRVEIKIGPTASLKLHHRFCVIWMVAEYRAELASARKWQR